jgi:hypothetical protein
VHRAADLRFEAGFHKARSRAVRSVTGHWHSPFGQQQRHEARTEPACSAGYQNDLPLHGPLAKLELQVFHPLQFDWICESRSHSL